MLSFHARRVACAIGLACLTSSAWIPQRAWAQYAEAPSLFPIPVPAGYAPAQPAADQFPVAQTASRESVWYGTGQPVPEPAVASPSDQPMISPDYQNAMKGGWDSCTTGVGGCEAPCATGCCPNHYIYANGLAMTRVKNGGFVAAVDATTFEPELLFCSPEYGNLWHGGFELGGGWCFGCGCNSGLEVVYWGLYAAPGTVTATGDLNSTIDFGDLDYNGADGNTYFQGAAAQRLSFDHDFHSLEVNLIGNYGGPLGCGRVGCCGTGCGERWGFGWLAGFRYINYTEDWLYSTNPNSNSFDGSDVDQLNYGVGLQNNLYGFQMGVGLDYCITNRLQAYAISKFGVYGNDIQMQQQISGSAGNATLNNGPFSGNEYEFDASDCDLSLAGQFDLGGRYAINTNWSFDFGYRVLALSGVAIAEDNVAQSNFQNVDGIASIQTTGSLILHGGYAGFTYAW
ncbi:MAG: BBP7 family outer membrane beta-barrel protein [Pirellulaceae bacterium]|jgi:hypothetical protein|nr:BBP7 family outer membrane beta-barrel protein [Pirellulaceae bacterium]